MHDSEVEFQRDEAGFRKLIERVGLTAPDSVLRGAPGTLVAKWTEPDLIEIGVEREHLTEDGVIPGPFASLMAAIGADMRRLITENDLPDPDIVRPGRRPGEVEFIWRESKLLIIVGEDGVQLPT